MKEMFNNLAKRKKAEGFCCLSYWFPILREIDTILTPITHIIQKDVPDDLINLCDGLHVKGFDKLAENIKEKASTVGSPFFLRTGLTSAKHSWDKTCFVKDIKKIKNHIYRIVEFSAMADIMGLSTNVWVVREYLPLDDNLIATGYGNMPITKERRYFFKDGKVEHHQPYWLKEAVEQGQPNKTNWCEILNEINYESNDEIEELTELTETVAKSFEGYWSADWLNVLDTWYLTDMALGEFSFRYDI